MLPYMGWLYYCCYYSTIVLVLPIILLFSYSSNIIYHSLHKSVLISLSYSQSHHELAKAALLDILVAVQVDGDSVQSVRLEAIEDNTGQSRVSHQLHWLLPEVFYPMDQPNNNS